MKKEPNDFNKLLQISGEKHLHGDLWLISLFSPLQVLVSSVTQMWNSALFFILLHTKLNLKKNTSLILNVKLGNWVKRGEREES